MDGVRDALVEAVRARLTAPRHAPETLPPDPGPVPGMGPAERRAARGSPVPGIGADLSGGSASGTLALLAAGLPGHAGHGPRPRHGRGRAAARRHLQRPGHAAGARPNWSGRGTIAANPRLHHVVVAAARRPCRTPTWTGPLTDEPGPSLVDGGPPPRAAWPRAAPTTSPGYGARQVLDAHPARLADLLMDRKRRHLVRPVAALARADGPSRAVAVRPADACTGAARRLARTPYRTGLESRGRPAAATRTVADRASDGPAGRLARRPHLVAGRARRRAG